MLTGKVAHVLPLQIVLNVHGVGYQVAVRKPTGFLLGTECTLHTYLAVRESAMDLYGFTLEDELAMFELLLTIPKIGPKSAMQILSQADLTLLKDAVVKNDPVYLTKMSGIGKKTAEKIVTELKDKIDVDGVYYSASNFDANDTADIIDALIALGYTQKDARDVLTQIPSEITTTNGRITEALRLLSPKN